MVIPVIIPVNPKEFCILVTFSTSYSDLEIRICGDEEWVYPKPAFVICVDATEPFVIVAVPVAVVPTPTPTSEGAEKLKI